MNHSESVGIAGAFLASGMVNYVAPSRLKSSLGIGKRRRVHNFIQRDLKTLSGSLRLIWRFTGSSIGTTCGV